MKNDVDMRQLNLVRGIFISKETKQAVKSVPLQTFKDSLEGILSDIMSGDEVVRALVACTEEVSTDGQTVTASAGKLSTALDFFKCYPMILKKSKNTSNTVGQIIKGNKPPMDPSSASVVLSKAPKEESQEEIDDKYATQLVDLVLQRMSDKYKNQTEVFRFMDTKGKGKVKKSDFIAAVEKARISLSKEDMTTVFNRIDTHRNGFFSYQDLCAAFLKQ